MPSLSGFTECAPCSTWSLIPSFGYSVSFCPPNSLALLVSLSQNSFSGFPSPISTSGADLEWLATIRSPSNRSVGLGWSSYPQDQVLRNQNVGSTSRVASSGAAFSTVICISRSRGAAFA